MLDLNIDFFYENTISDFKNAEELFSNWEEFVSNSYPSNNEEKRYTEILLDDYIQTIILKIQFVLEFL